MLFLLQSFAAWIAAALALGLVCGLPAAWAGQGLRWSGWGALLAVVYCSGVAAAALQLAPGRAGFWLETGLLIFGAYALGVFWGGLCAAVLSRLFGRRRERSRRRTGARRRETSPARLMLMPPLRARARPPSMRRAGLLASGQRLPRRLSPSPPSRTSGARRSGADPWPRSRPCRGSARFGPCQLRRPRAPDRRQAERSSRRGWGWTRPSPPIGRRRRGCWPMASRRILPGRTPERAKYVRELSAQRQSKNAPRAAA